MTSEDVSVGFEAGRLTRLLLRFAALLGLAATIVTPAAYFGLSVSYESADLAGAAERRAREISLYIYSNQEMWAFEPLRLEEMLKPTASQTSAYFRVDQLKGSTSSLIVELGSPPAWPYVERDAPILDGDIVVGHVVAQRSLSPLLLRLPVIALISGTIGFAIFALIRFFSVPILEQSFRRLAVRDGELAASRANLERLVAKRTHDLHLANEQLKSSLVELAEREAENHRLALVVQQIDSCVIVMSPAGEIEWVNDAFTRMTGYALAEVIGAKPGRLLRGPDTDPEAIKTMRAAFRDGRSYSVEVLLYTKSGDKLWSEFDSTIVRDEKERVTSCIAIGRDIGARKAQEQRLAEALENERAITQQQRRFVSVVAHEFRTPLTIIDGAAQRILRNADAAKPGDLRERGDKIRNAVARMGQLIDTTLSTARLDSGKIELNRVDLDLARLVAQICERVRGIASGFDISVVGAETKLMVDGDERLLDQVFTNLLTNAVKYSGDSRRIDVALSKSDGRVEVAFRDYGIGVPADEVPQLFTRYFRASTARGISGTGIGLNLARDLVEMHGGEIVVASHPGKGSTFTVRLDLKPVRDAAA